MYILKTFRLEDSLVQKLANLAKRTQRAEKFYVEEALRHYFAEYEDCQIAKDLLMIPKARSLPAKKCAGA